MFIQNKKAVFNAFIYFVSISHAMELHRANARVQEIRASAVNIQQAPENVIVPVKRSKRWVWSNSVSSTYHDIP